MAKSFKRGSPGAKAEDIARRAAKQSVERRYGLCNAVWRGRLDLQFTTLGKKNAVHCPLRRGQCTEGRSVALSVYNSPDIVLHDWSSLCGCDIHHTLRLPT